eukprot:gnl/Spiro4/17550_TR9351_c0_g1_i1.p1 gnl/Spiro4/17550_TR9351_c0_g1~~gnl/Spiro4/17550_TR9351_c0_g1_i1.p1  ORF type:complete len:518 (-),score=71.82 gnl/Spiro4/17550_TR9351_c0_g1_i1:81-1634(-)
MLSGSRVVQRCFGQQQKLSLCWLFSRGVFASSAQQNIRIEIPEMKLRQAVTFDDVLLVPKKSPVNSRKDISLASPLTRNIILNLPIVSSNMDTVTEAAMAIQMARKGGIGILHRFLSIEDQVNMVRQVKRAANFVVSDPWTISPETDVSDLLHVMESKGVGSFLVSNPKRELVGIITTRDVRFRKDGDKVRDLMTPREKLVVASPDVTNVQAQEIMQKARVEKLPLVDDQNRVSGLITAKDVAEQMRYPHRTLDPNGNLRVGAAVGVKQAGLDRAAALVKAGVDVLVVDIAHGHSSLGIETTAAIKKAYPHVELISGNVATAEGTRDLINAGADGVKVGVGGGSICITRKQTGAGVPQLQAIWDCSYIAKQFGIPIIADGGIRNSGDLTKALAAGACTVMLGNVLAGTDETPGRPIMKDGRAVRIIRGMAGYGSNISKAEREGAADIPFEFVPEGVEGVVPCRGPVANILLQLAGGVKSGISYCGATNILEMQNNAEWVQMSSAGVKESGAHDIKEF